MVDNLITADPRLKHLDVRIYNVLAGSRRGALVTVGERRIASLSHADRRNVRAGLKRLIAAGYVTEQKPCPSGHRARYRLTDKRFGAQQQEPQVSANREEPIVKSAPIGAPKVPKLAKCPNCQSSQLKKLLKIGWCQSCNHAKRQELKMRRVAEKVYDERAQVPA